MQPLRVASSQTSALLLVSLPLVGSTLLSSDQYRGL